jgi:hypothetical protein
VVTFRQWHFLSFQQNLHRCSEPSAGPATLHKDFGCDSAVAMKPQCPHRLLIPAGVHDSESIALPPERQRPEPRQVRFHFRGRQLRKRRCVLPMVFVASRPKVGLGACGMVGRVESDGIKLVIAQHCYGSTVLNHRSHGLQRFANRWSTVNEIPKENRFSERVTETVSFVLVPQRCEQLQQLWGMSVDVSDDVVANRFHCRYPVLSSWCTKRLQGETGARSMPERNGRIAFWSDQQKRSGARFEKSF